MPEQTLLQLEELLRRMGSVEVTEDVTHKYALRRALLNSTRFERNRFRLVWMRFFTYSTTLVAGGAIVAVLVVSVMSFELPDMRRSAPGPSAGSSVRIAPIQLVDMGAREGQSVIERPGLSPEAEPFVSRSTSVQFASFELRPEVRHVLEFAQPSISFAVAR
ncbi:MAG: hypothetical protein WCO25_04750 [Candidatus Uhrbacteria bacterium]